MSKPGRVIAFDRWSGATCWTCELDYLGGSPTRATRSLLLAKSARTLFALELGSGAVVWTWQPATRAGEWIYTQPFVDGDSVFVADRRGIVTCLDLQTGSVSWSTRPCELDPASINASPLVVDDLVLTADIQSRVFALDKTTGSLCWTQELGDASISALASTSRGGVIIRTEHAISELAPDTGAVIRDWQSVRPLWHHTVWGEGVLVVVQGEIIDEVDDKRMVNGSIVRLQEGEVLWETEATGSQSFVRVLPSLHMVIEMGGFELRALDLDTGQPLWTAAESSHDYGEALPEVSDGALYRLVRRLEADEGEVEGVLQALDLSGFLRPGGGTPRLGG